MLHIRQAQMDRMSEQKVSEFEGWLADYLPQAFPEQTSNTPREVLLRRIRAGIRKAESYGIELQDDIRRFIELLVTYGDDCDADPARSWIGESLQRSDCNGTQKMELIDELELASFGGASA